MAKQLSNAFFGDKKLTQSIYSQIISRQDPQNVRFTNQHIREIFQPYTIKLQSISSQDNSLTLLDLFAEFMIQVSEKFIKWQFQKFSSVMEISAHVFEHSFQQWLTKQESYKYFSDAIVRHSLFRPPHSVCIFSYEEMRQVTEFWVEHFLRFYEEYEEGFKSSLNEKVVGVVFPQKIDKQQSLGSGKTVGKQAIARFS